MHYSSACDHIRVKTFFHQITLDYTNLFRLFPAFKNSKTKIKSVHPLKSYLTIFKTTNNVTDSKLSSATATALTSCSCYCTGTAVASNFMLVFSFVFKIIFADIDRKLDCIFLVKNYSAQTRSNAEQQKTVSDKFIGLSKNWFFVKFLFQLSTFLTEP